MDIQEKKCLTVSLWKPQKQTGLSLQPILEGSFLACSGYIPHPPRPPPPPPNKKQKNNAVRMYFIEDSFIINYQYAE